MPWLLRAIGEDGLIRGQCDQRCYNGTRKNCACICGGKCHGTGEQLAATAAITIETIDARGLAKPSELPTVHLRKNPKLYFLAHPRLFDDM